MMGLARITVGNNHDYQKSMGFETRSIDEAGEQAAEQTTVENYGVHGEMVTTETESGAKYKKELGTFGMVQPTSIDIGYTAQRATFFQKLAEQTGTQRNPLGLGSARDTAAYRSQKQMAANYTVDMSLLPNAQRDFDLFVPMANMAARSYMKTNEVADQLGFNETKGPSLNAKDNKAISKASEDKQGSVLDQGQSLELAGRNMQSARRGVVVASHLLASVVKTESAAALEMELEKAGEKKAEIQAKIAKATRIVGYLETAGQLVAGGAGLIHDNLSAGKPDKTDHDDLRDSSVEKTQKGGEHVQKGAGHLSTAVAFGLEFYHARELEQIEVQIDVVRDMLAASGAEKHRNAIEHAKLAFGKSAHDYETAVQTYQAAINDRRKRMAAIGANADKMIDKKGQDTDTSDAMLYTTTVMETQSFLQVGFDAATAASERIAEVSREVYAHRDHKYGVLADAYTGNNVPRSEGRGAPDVAALTQMRQLVTWWLEGATEVKEVIDQVASNQGAPVLAAAGYTAKY